MSSAFSSIKQGLEEALELSKGNASKAVIHEFTAFDVKDLRAKMGMSLDAKRIGSHEKRI